MQVWVHKVVLEYLQAIIGVVAVEATLCGSLNKKSKEKIVEGKRSLTSIAVTIER